MQSLRSHKSLFLAVALGAFAAADASAQRWRPPCSAPLVQEARNPNPRVIPPKAQLFGLSYAEWGAAWWRWVLAVPAAMNPMLDPTGAHCAVNQHGPVFFLAGTSGASAIRQCSVPQGKFLFFPIINFIADWPCPGPDFCAGVPLGTCLTDLAQFFMDHVTDLECVIDGRPLHALHRYRATSDVFSLTGDPSLTVFDPCITGTPQPAVSDGFWIMLAPLPPGVHTIRFRGRIVVPGPGGFDFETQVSYTLAIS
jgi:hypothetical protein